MDSSVAEGDETTVGEGRRSRGAAEVDALVLEILERIESEGLRALRTSCEAHPELAAELHERFRVLFETGLLLQLLPGPHVRGPASATDSAAGRAGRSGRAPF